jgi:ankyrin repeat protein
MRRKNRRPDRRQFDWIGIGILAGFAALLIGLCLVWFGRVRHAQVLKTAIIERRKARVEQLLAKNAYAQDEIDETLSYYFMSGSNDPNLEVLRLLLRHHADPNSKKNNDPPLLQTIYRNDLAAARLLIAYGADPKKGGYTKSLVAESARQSKPEFIKLFLAHGGDPNQKDYMDNTPLQACIASNDGASAKVLLDHGVDPNQTGGKGNNGVVNNDAILCVALAQGASKVSRELILHGANVNVVAFEKQTPLTLAKQHQNKELVALLRSRGAKEQFVNETGKSSAK